MIFSSGSYAQTKGIKLINKISNDSIFLPENSRIEIETIRGKEIVGKYTIVNDSVINIKKKMIEINTILSLKATSTGSDLLHTFSTVIGSIFVVIGILVGRSASPTNDAGTAGLVIATAGATMIIVPLAVNKHQNKKWTYVIVNQ